MKSKMVKEMKPKIYTNEKQKAKMSRKKTPSKPLVRKPDPQRYN